MEKLLKEVKTFVERTAEIPKDSKNIPLEAKKLVISLIFEELHEYSIACNLEQVFDNLCLHTQTERYKVDPNKDTTDEVEQLDALGDIIYSTLFGAVLTGHGKTISHALEEISKSNESKTYKDYVSAVENLQYVKEKRFDKVKLVETPKGFCIKDTKGKVVKGEQYFPPNLKDSRLLNEEWSIKESEISIDSYVDRINQIELPKKVGISLAKKILAIIEISLDKRRAFTHTSDCIISYFEDRLIMDIEKKKNLIEIINL